jgi:hypothetical protein
MKKAPMYPDLIAQRLRGLSNLISGHHTLDEDETFFVCMTLEDLARELYDPEEQPERPALEVVKD